MSGITLKEVVPTIVPTPASGKDTIFIDSSNGNAPSYKDSAGIVHTLAGATGPAGLTGANGPPGYGDQGDDGDIILVPGPVGPTGATGAAGPAGSGAGTGAIIIDDIPPYSDDIPSAPYSSNPLTSVTFPIFVPFQKNFFASAMGLATPTVVGMQAITSSGTTPVVGTTDSDGYNIACSTTASSGNNSFLVISTNFVQTRFGLDITFWVKTGSDVTNVCFWLGIFEVAPTGVVTFPTNNGCIAFRSSTAVPDTGWVGATQVQGAGGSNSVTASLSSALVANTVYKLRLRIAVGGAAVYFSVNDGAEILKTNNLPTVLTTNYTLAVGPVANASVVKTLKFYGLMGNNPGSLGI